MIVGDAIARMLSWNTVAPVHCEYLYCVYACAHIPTPDVACTVHGYACMLTLACHAHTNT